MQDSYQGYLDVLELLGVEDEPLQPVERVHVSDAFSGSKARNYASTFTERFDAYRFDWLEMTVTINGAPAQDYGMQDYYLSGQDEAVTYGTTAASTAGTRARSYSPPTGRSGTIFW